MSTEDKVPSYHLNPKQDKKWFDLSAVGWLTEAGEELEYRSPQPIWSEVCGCHFHYKTDKSLPDNLSNYGILKNQILP